jgi:hypothetical protein
MQDANTASVMQRQGRPVVWDTLGAFLRMGFRTFVFLRNCRHVCPWSNMTGPHSVLASSALRTAACVRRPQCNMPAWATARKVYQ